MWFESVIRTSFGVDSGVDDGDDADEAAAAEGGEKPPGRQSTGSSFFVKTIDKGGRIRLCIMQLLPIPARANPATGAVEHGFVLRIEVAPPSRHLTDRPEMSTATFKKQLAASAPPASITGRLRKRRNEAASASASGEEGE